MNSPNATARAERPIVIPRIRTDFDADAAEVATSSWFC